MAYQNNIPQPTNRLKDSQGDILNNFAALKTLIDVNHGTFGASDEGKHKFVTMPEQAVDPATLANEMALYTKDVGSVSHLFLRGESNATPIDLSFKTASPGAFSEGFTTLPSGLILKWGRTTGGFLPNNSWTQITFGTPFPTSCFNIQALPKITGSQPTMNGTAQSFVIDPGYNQAGFYVFNRTNNATIQQAVDICWFALGV